VIHQLSPAQTAGRAHADAIRIEARAILRSDEDRAEGGYDPGPGNPCGGPDSALWIAGALAALELGAVYLDGELCVLNEDGTTSFSGMQAAADSGGL
jgi:hypothetical protein